MSMIANYLMVDEEVIKKVQDREFAIEEVIYASEESEHSVIDVKEDEYIDIDKAWHAIHYLLCGSTWEGELPLFNLVLGGEEINNQDVGYGPARYLTCSQVKEVYEAIKDITSEDLHKRFNVKEMLEADIYPQFDREDDFEYIGDYYEYLKSFFKRAAERGKAVLKFIN